MRYDWGDGKGKKHSRPKRTGQQLQQAKDAKLLNDPNYFTQPQTLGQALQEGGRAADLVYGPQIAQVQLQQQQTPAWFNDYRASLLTPQQVQAQYQPAIQQSEKDAAATGQTLGLEGQAGETDKAAAAAREALMKLGTSTLMNAQQADTSYFQGRQGVAQAAEVGAKAQLGSQLGSLQGQRGAAVAQFVSDARQGERRYGLDTQHQANENKAFGLDVYKAQTDAADKAADNRAAAKDKRQKANAEKQKVNQYGYSNEQWARFSPSHRRRIINEGKGSSSDKAKPRFTPEQTQKSNASLRKAVALVQGKLGGKQTAPDTFWKQAYQALVSEKDMDPAMARAAIQLVRLGHVGGKTRRTLEQDYGITKLPRGAKRKKPDPYVLPKRPTAPSRDRQPG